MIWSRLYRALAAAGAFLLFVGAAVLKIRSNVEREVERDVMEDTLDRVQKGRDAVRDGRGSDPAERLRKNDGKW